MCDEAVQKGHGAASVSSQEQTLDFQIQPRECYGHDNLLADIISMMYNNLNKKQLQY